MAKTVKPIGFTVLQDPELPELDIVFVHGLDGHPRKSWTYFPAKDQPSTNNTREKATKFAIVFTNLVLLSTGWLFMAWPLLIASWLSMNWLAIIGFLSWKASAKRSPEEAPVVAVADGSQAEVFWPKDLLPNLEQCEHARILTYGYDSSYFDLTNKINFSDITSQGESLLNGLARVRADCDHRPLMFIAHSLGGLIVKATLNDSRMKSDVPNAKDLHAVVDSTFAAIFFGTPHRGTDLADFGLRVARVASAITLKSYNPNIIRALARKSEVLKNLRRNFDATLEYMISKGHFQSSTFQEDKSFSTVAGFTGKVVEDDSSEMGSYDRNDHINADHVDMCKFWAPTDPEYEKVAGEIERHIRRVVAAGTDGLVSSLEILGGLANVRMSTIWERTEGTLEWLFTSRATFDKRQKSDPPTGKTPCTLESWLSDGKGLFWITGLPGSGKSTAMRHPFESSRRFWIKGLPGSGKSTAMRHLSESSRRQLITGLPGSGKSVIAAQYVRNLEHPSTSHPGSQYGLNKDEDSSSLTDREGRVWKRIGLFITNFEGETEQGKWETMLHGFLLQLLRLQPNLRRAMRIFARNIEQKQRHLRRNFARIHREIDWSHITWSNDLVRQALKYCLKMAGQPLSFLVIVDGLDELENDDITREAARFLKDLAEGKETSNAFRICVASRPVQHLLDIFQKSPRIEIHHHTRADIRRHAWSKLHRNIQFNGMREEDIRTSLEPLLDYIVENAAGVFLWAHSIAVLADDELNNYSRVEGLHHKMEKLPKTMDDLYRRLLGQIKPQLRIKAYIALEAVFRHGTMSLEAVYHTVEATELWLEESHNPGSNTSRQDFRKDIDPADLRQFQKQIAASCRCMLRFQEFIHGDDGLVDQRVSLVHASAREYLLRLNFLDILFPPDGPTKPIGNGHGYYLLYVRSWLRSLTRPEDDWYTDHLDILETASNPGTIVKIEDVESFSKFLTMWTTLRHCLENNGPAANPATMAEPATLHLLPGQ